VVMKSVQGLLINLQLGNICAEVHNLPFHKELSYLLVSQSALCRGNELNAPTNEMGYLSAGICNILIKYTLIL
jgi:hypothetical protein